MKDRERPFYKIFNGHRIPGAFSEEALEGFLRYQPADDDIFVVTFPKCGTRWTHMMLSKILQVCRGLSPRPFILAEREGVDAILAAPRPRIVCAHLPFHLTPRNERTNYGFADGTFEEYFEIFLEGLTDFGNYYENLKSWYARKDDPNVLFMTYETMKFDNRRVEHRGIMTTATGSKLKPIFQLIDGIKIPLGFDGDKLRSALKYQASSGDVFIDTFPKCGTNWTKRIVELLIGGNDVASQKDGYGLATTFFEMVGKDTIAALPEPRIVTTHLEYQLVPKHPSAKYIYVVRNPKDCCVSFFHHTKKTKAYNFEQGTFEDYLQLFIKGETELRRLLRAPGLKDPAAAVLRIAKFLDVRDAELLDADSNRFKEIVRDSSIDAMKEHYNASYQKALGGNGVDEWIERKDYPLARAPPPPDVMVRKGIIGDWRNHFTADQSRRIEQAFVEKCGHVVDHRKIWNPEDWMESVA
ncbi:hypothetical protein MTO96_041357 [Rhipicephalus appendiculatus]